MKRIEHTFLGVVVFLLIWQAAAMLINKNIIIPTPLETVKIIMRLMVSAKIWGAMVQTVWKTCLSLFLAIVIGVPVGFIFGLSKDITELFRPLIMVVQTVPVVSWLSVVIFAWGIGWKGPVFIAFLSLVPISILTTISGVKHFDIHLLEVAAVYRIPKGKVIKDIYLGSLAPFFSAILDVSMGQAWKVILVSEYLCGGNGLGEQILMARMNINTAEVWAITLIAVMLGIFVEQISKAMMHRMSQNWEIA